MHSGSDGLKVIRDIFYRLNGVSFSVRIHLFDFLYFPVGLCSCYSSGVIVVLGICFQDPHHLLWFYDPRKIISETMEVTGSR